MQTLSPAWNLSLATTNRWYGRVLPSLVDLAFLLPIVLLFAKLNGTKTLFADADTGWHIRTGQWIIQHHAVPTQDLFSFTMPNQSWFAWEWGWDVLFAAVHDIAGLGGVGLVCTLVLSLFSISLFLLLRRVSHNHAVSFFVTVMAICASSVHWLARPHLFSMLFAVILLHLLHTADHENKKALLFTPLLLAVWTNIHGGFVAGLLILFCHAFGLMLSQLFAGPGPLTGTRQLRSAFAQTRLYWLALLLSLGATLINPYGWHLHQHIFHYLTDEDLLSRISEFQSMSFHAPSAMLFEIMLVLAGFAAFWKLQSVQIAPALAILVWAHYALLSARHIPLFLVVAAPQVAALLEHVIQRLRQVALLSEAAATVTEICEELAAMERPGRLHILSAATVVLLAVLFAAGKQPFTPQFDAESFPAQAVPFLQARAALHPREAGAGSRVYTYDQWGDYLIYRLYPSQRVFFDGRSDFYGVDFVKINQRITTADYDWKKLLRNYGIEMVILKPDAPLSAVLKITPGSKVLFDDGKVIVFQIDGIYQTKRTASGSAQQAINLPSPELVPQSAKRMSASRQKKPELAGLPVGTADTTHVLPKFSKTSLPVLTGRQSKAGRNCSQRLGFV
jgi:hypothetical protein